MLKPFSFNVADFPKVVFGPGTVGAVGVETARWGRRAFVLTGKGSARRTGVLQRVLSSLEEQNLVVDVFEGIEPNPRLETLRAAAEQARRFDAEVVVAVGGGSTMDAAKGLTTELAYPGQMWDFVLRGAQTRTPEKSLPIVTVPTTAATGSETNATGVITWWERHEKMPLVNPAALPKVAIMDPELTLTLPWETTLAGAADILAHLLETYIPSPEVEPQDSFTEGSFRA
ncbi:MAG: iron-containing alcohol dehydrogenase, partial [Armatimonadota bacterium]|nr:iron-containing alcohol dehydrogenase [Armatimonadota bacterium]